MSLFRAENLTKVHGKGETAVTAHKKVDATVADLTQDITFTFTDPDGFDIFVRKLPAC